MKNTAGLTLAIESAIAGGSLSLLRDGVEIGNWIGTTGVSKAEELLPNLDQLLRENGATKRELTLLAVSAGPGSFTGIRIGIATAMGLKKGLGLPLSSISVLEAIARNSAAEFVNALVAVPVGRDAICVQRFANEQGTIASTDSAASVSISAYADLVMSEYNSVFLAHPNLAGLGGGAAGDPNRPCDIGMNLAKYVGLENARGGNSNQPPIFISKSF